MPPVFAAPMPPRPARVYSVDSQRLIGFTPLLKYAPAGLQMTMNVTCCAGRTPRNASEANMNGRM